MIRPSPALRASLEEQLVRLRGAGPLPAPLLDVVVEQEPIGTATLAVLRPRDWRALREAEADASRPTPYWAIPWASGLALAREVGAQDGLEGRRVVELGCGLGVPSLVAARAGARVVALDASPDAVVFAAHNLALNDGKGETALADFHEAAPLLAAEPRTLVLAADVLYQRRNVELLLDLLGPLLDAGGELWLADPGRVGGQELLATAKRVWRVHTARDPQRGDVRLHRLSARR